MFEKARALSLLVMLILGQVRCALSDDALLDRFSYEEKLLKKVIRMELKMEMMERSMQQTQEKMTNTLQNLTLEIENKTAELMLLEGNMSTPMVAFNAYNLADYSPDTNQILILQNTYINEGNGYDPVLGLFTAPVAGLYMFSFNACGHSGQYFYFYIIVDNNVIAKSTKYNTAAYDCAATTTLTKLEVGQRAWVKCPSGTTSNQLSDGTYRQSTFSGVLLHG